MPFSINHYIPKFILKTFCEEGTKNINLLDITCFNVYKENIAKAFTKIDFYDVADEDDPKTLEKKFNQKLENLVAPIIKKIIDSDDNFKIYRYELELIKKYIAIQRYRNPSNQYYYTNNYTGMKFSNYSKLDFEDDSDYWKREMLFILDNDWDTIINQNEYPGVKFICREINSEYLTFFRTEAEYVISDINCFTERIKLNIPNNEKDDFLKFAKEMLVSQNLTNVKDINELNIGDNNIFDNYTFIVLSPKLAVASVNSFWKLKHLRRINSSSFASQIRSVILENNKNIALPRPIYVNADMIKTDSDIVKHKDKNDEYTYRILNLTFEETKHVMMLCLNEANLFLGYRDKNFVSQYIKAYNFLSSSGVPNIKKNYNGYIQLIENLSKENK